MARPRQPKRAPWPRREMSDEAAEEWRQQVLKGMQQLYGSDDETLFTMYRYLRGWLPVSAADREHLDAHLEVVERSIWRLMGEPGSLVS